MATDIKVVKTVFEIDSTDIDEAKSKYNSLTKSINDATESLKKQSSNSTDVAKNLNSNINTIVKRTNDLQSEYQKISLQASKTFDPKLLDLYKQKMQSLQSEAKELGVKLTDTNKQTEKLKTNVSNIGSTIAGAFAIGSIVSFGKAVLDVTVKNEQLTKSFEVMLKSKVQADALMAQLVQFAKTTPFALTEVAEATKRLLAFGVASSDIEKTLIKLGDVSAGIGAPLNDIAYLFGTIKTQGRAMTMDINQFTNRGIPMWEELAKVTGLSGLALKKYVEEGKVGFKEIEQAFTNLTSEGGKFTGLMDAQSKTLGGTISNLGDSWDQFLVKLGSGNDGVMKATVQGLSNILDAVTLLQKGQADYVNDIATVLNKDIVKDVEKDYEQALNIFKDSNKTKQQILEEEFNRKSSFRQQVLKEQKKELDSLQSQLDDYNNNSNERFKDRLHSIVTLSDKTRSKQIENDIIEQKARIQNTELYLKTLSDVLKKKTEENNKLQEQESEKERKARLERQKKIVDDELNLLRHEEQIAKQDAINKGANATEILMIEDKFNYKRIEIYEKYSSILNNKQRQDQETTIQNADTLAIKIVESDKKLYEERIKANEEWSKKINEQHLKSEKDLQESLNRKSNIEQDKIRIKKANELIKMYEDTSMSIEDKAKKRAEIEAYYTRWALEETIKSDEEKLEKLTLNSEEYIALEAKIAEEKVKLNEDANKQIVEDDKKTAKEKGRIAKEALDLLKEGINAIYQYSQYINTAELQDLKDKEERELKLAGDNQAKKEAIATKYEAQQAVIRRKQFEQNKQLALINIAINTAEGVSKAVSQFPFPTNLLPISFAVASGAIQTALVNAQPAPKFAKGGRIKGKSHAEGGEIIEAERDEWVINAKASREFHPLLKAINEGTFNRKDLSPELSSLLFGRNNTNISLNTDSLAHELRSMPKNHISIDKDGFHTHMYSEFMNRESLNNRYQA
jgi:tape measure domain-containing protein